MGDKLTLTSWGGQTVGIWKEPDESLVALITDEGQEHDFVLEPDEVERLRDWLNTYYPSPQQHEGQEQQTP